MSNIQYRVTDAAPSHVCGQRVQAGDTLSLPTQVAEYERDLGHIERVVDEVEASPVLLPVLDRDTLTVERAIYPEAVLPEPRDPEPYPTEE